MLRAVKFWSYLPRLLSIIAILGLLTAPMAAPSAAAAMAAQPEAAGNMAGMAGGMPCSPAKSKQSLPDCEKSCPLAALCSGKCFPNTPAVGEARPVLFEAGTQLAFWSDPARDRLTDPPPSRPPRT